MPKNLPHLAALLFALCVALFGSLKVSALADPGLSMTVLDIGQGDAILIRCGAEETLIDGGPGDSVLAAVGRALPPYDRTIERLVLTHPHRDHYEGLTAILNRYEVGEIIVAEDGSDTDTNYTRFLAAAKTDGAPMRRVATGDHFTVGDCATLETLSPEPGSAHKDPNEGSIVFRLVRAGEERALALLTGDATEDTERELLAQKTDLRAQVLKVGHHGSKYSSSPDFLAAVAPDVAAISVAAKNRYGHPAYLALQRLEQVGATVLRTDLHGNIRIEFPENAPPVVHSEK